MHRTRLAFALLLALPVLTVAGCERPAPSAVPESPASKSLPISPASTAPIAPAEIPVEAAAKPGLPPTSRDPDTVLRAWADAVEARDWTTVRAFWGDHGARSGLSEAAFARQWSSLRQPRVILSKGDGEGGAGSLYYTAPVRIADGTRTISGEIVIRRVNDVDGASPEQLRWHIESTTLAP